MPLFCPLIHHIIPQDGKTRCTTGSVVSSLYHLKDSENDNRDAGFFVFPDLSVRQEGSYRLKLSLFEVVGCVPTFPFVLSLPFTFLSPSSALFYEPTLALSYFTSITKLYLFATKRLYRFRVSYLSVPFYTEHHPFRLITSRVPYSIPSMFA